MGKRKKILGGMVMTLLIMYVLTGILLFLLSALTFSQDLSQQVVKMVIVIIYILAGLCGGFVIGKFMKVKKFLWGALAGVAYFAILVIVSLAVNGGSIQDTVQLLVTFVLCTASATIGGMVS